MTRALSDPLSISPLQSASRWIEGVALGPIATAICVIAIASTGYAMMTGRIDLRRGASVIAGCFLIFGAQTIARGVTGNSMTLAAAPPIYTQTSPLEGEILEDQNYDPYAGASVPRR